MSDQKQHLNILIVVAPIPESLGRERAKYIFQNLGENLSISSTFNKDTKGRDFSLKIPTRNIFFKV